MKIPYKIIIIHPLNEEKTSQILSIIDQIFNEVDFIYNNWNKESEITQFNLLSSTEAVPISNNLYSLLKKVEECFLLTDGRFDPTVAPLSDLFNQSCSFSDSFNQSSYDGDVRVDSIGWNNLLLKEKSFQKKNPSTRLDLCGISKGYAIDLLIDRFKDSGIDHALVEWGGEIRAIGKHINRDWMVTIDENFSPISLENCAIATSGSYIQKIKTEKGVFSHIFNPKTKKPLQLNSLSKVSVLAPTCAMADALATAALTFENKESAKQWAQEISLKNKEIIFYFFSNEGL